MGALLHDRRTRTLSARTTVSGTWPAQAATVPAARRLVRSYLAEQGLEGLVPDAELLVSELVGNVVLHVGGNVEVVAVAGPDRVLIEVTDASPVAPQLRVFSRTSSTGRGMRLVHSLAVEHGVRAAGRGKTIWVLVTAATCERSDDDLADSFADIDWLADLVEPAPEGEQGSSDRAAGLHRVPAAPSVLFRPAA